MFTKHAIFVHKICDFKSLAALQSLQGGLICSLGVVYQKSAINIASPNEKNR